MQAESDHKAAKARVESEFNEKLVCLRERLEADVQDKRKELEAKHATELENLRSELESNYREVWFWWFFAFLSAGPISLCIVQILRCTL